MFMKHSFYSILVKLFTHKMVSGVWVLLTIFACSCYANVLSTYFTANTLLFNIRVSGKNLLLSLVNIGGKCTQYPIGAPLPDYLDCVLKGRAGSWHTEFVTNDAIQGYAEVSGGICIVSETQVDAVGPEAVLQFRSDRTVNGFVYGFVLLFFDKCVEALELLPLVEVL